MIYCIFPIFLIVCGICVAIYHRNLIKRLMAISIAQTGIVLLYIVFGARHGISAPFYYTKVITFVSPLHQALMLTAIVVGFATTAFGLALITKIKQSSGTIKASSDSNS